METTTHYLLLLDCSGSMQSCWTATLQALDTQLDTIGKAVSENPNCRVKINLIVFNDRTEVLAWQQIAGIAQRFPVNHLFPEGNTAMFDALGFSIQQLKGAMQAGDAALVTLLTDGMENASRHFNTDQIRALMEELKASGHWSFSFIGADFDIFSHLGEALNLDRKNTTVFSKECIQDDIRVVNNQYTLFFKKVSETGDRDFSTFDF
jgi:uncharacterized protein YegL